MNILEFEQIFKGGRNCNINWDRAKKEKWKVTTEIIDTKDKLGSLRSCWTKDGPVYDGGSTVTLDDASLNHGDRIKILGIAKSIQENGGKFSAIVPAMQAASGPVLIDGNNRLSALLLTNVPFAIVVCTVSPKTAYSGPEDWG